MLAEHEQDRLVELLVATAEVIGDQLRPTAAAFMVTDLAGYPLPMLDKALASCRRELKGKLSLAAIWSASMTATRRRTRPGPSRSAPLMSRPRWCGPSRPATAGPRRCR